MSLFDYSRKGELENIKLLIESNEVDINLKDPVKILFIFFLFL